jgi:hypothetical protein
MAMVNTLAYYNTATIGAVKSFVVQAPDRFPYFTAVSRQIHQTEFAVIYNRTQKARPFLKNKPSLIFEGKVVGSLSRCNINGERES